MTGETKCPPRSCSIPGSHKQSVNGSCTIQPTQFIPENCALNSTPDTQLCYSRQLDVPVTPMDPFLEVNFPTVAVNLTGIRSCFSKLPPPPPTRSCSIPGNCTCPRPCQPISISHLRISQVDFPVSRYKFVNFWRETQQNDPLTAVLFPATGRAGDRASPPPDSASHDLVSLFTQSGLIS